MSQINTIYNEDCLTGLKKLADNFIDCCVTSPPYFGLRDYGVNGQIGLEETPELYVEKLVNVFREVKRVLKPDGTLWLNLGDSYWGGKGQSGTQSPEEAAERNKKGLAITSEHQQLGGNGVTRPTDRKHKTIKPKDLIGIPWMVAFALRANGWYLRQDIIWSKPNPMPESVTDRCTKAHEYIFLLSKSRQYYYDAEAIKSRTIEPEKTRSDSKKTFPTKYINGIRNTHVAYELANKRSVWNVNPIAFKEAHFATFPEKLIVDCIKAGCPEGGTVLDPFMGAGTTALVARKLNRNYIGFELNEKYIEIANKRLYVELGMFL